MNIKSFFFYYYYNNLSGTVTYINGGISGCVACPPGFSANAGNGNTCYNPCSAPEYKFVQEGDLNNYSCLCEAGYFGSVNYEENGLIIANSCTACRNGLWSLAGNPNTCTPILCSGGGYAVIQIEGSETCVCASNYR